MTRAAHSKNWLSSIPAMYLGAGIVKDSAKPITATLGSQYFNGSFRIVSRFIPIKPVLFGPIRTRLYRLL
jgi:hypothetical protein